MGLTVRERKTLLRKRAARYRESTKKQKVKMLDEFIHATDYSRKHVGWIQSNCGRKRVARRRARRNGRRTPAKETKKADGKFSLSAEATITSCSQRSASCAAFTFAISGRNNTFSSSDFAASIDCSGGWEFLSSWSTVFSTQTMSCLLKLTTKGIVWLFRMEAQPTARIGLYARQKSVPGRTPSISFWQEKHAFKHGDLNVRRSAGFRS